MAQRIIKCEEPLKGVVAVRACSEPTVAINFKAYRKKYKKLLKRINTASSNDELKSRIKTFFKSYAVCYVAIVRSAKKRKLIFRPDELDSLANQLSRSKDFSETITIKTKNKTNGSLRYLSKSGHKRLAVQYLVHEVQIALNIGFAFDTVQKGNGGRDKFVSGVIAAYRDRGLPYVVKLDIKDFFCSIGHKAVWDIMNLFPVDIINFHVLNHSRHYLCLSDINQIHKQRVMRMARKGIPQGSPSSSRIASAVIEQILGGISSLNTCEIYCNGDDIAICTSSFTEAEVIKNAFISKSKDHPFGPFHLKHCDVYHIPKGVEFLGYWIKTFPFYDHNKDDPQNVIAVPSQHSFDAFFNKLGHKLNKSTNEAFVNEAWAYAKNWLKAYKLWKCIPQVNQDGTTYYDYPAQGVHNLIIQIEMAIFEEDKRRGYTKTLDWLYDFKKRCVFSRPHLEQVGLIKTVKPSQMPLLEQQKPMLRLCDYRVKKKSMWLIAFQYLYIKLHGTLLKIDKKFRCALKLN